MMRRRERIDSRARAMAAADTAQRLSVLLTAGIAPERAWTYIGQVDQGPAEAIAQRISSGTASAEAIEAEGAEWHAISAAWRVASAVGAPLSSTLRAVASSARDSVDAADDISIALAEPAATAKIMSWLPVVGILLGLAMGFDTIATLTTNPAGVACALGGIALTVAARLWTKRLVAQASDLPRSPGLHQELTAIALSGGVSVARAAVIVRDAGAIDHDDHPATDRVLRLSQLAGVPAAELLRQDAGDERARTRTEARVRGARLSSRLLLPLGVCTLPAFFLLGVAPMMISVISATPVGW